MNDAVGKRDEPFIAAYRGLYGYATKSPELEAGVLYETHSANLSIQLIVAEAQQHFLVYERLPKATKDMTRYTVEDQDALAQRYADVKFPGRNADEWVTFGDVWAQKKWSAMADLEEGIVARWHEGRSVLLGDAAHKMTPNTGFGMNSGLQGVAQLVNRLHSLLQKTAEPSTEMLSKVFAEYQASRLANSKEAVEMSALYTRLVAWNNPVWRFADQYVLPYVKGDVTSLNLLMSPIVQKGIPLDFIEEKAFVAGKYRYYTAPSAVQATTEVA
jgi:2-polyprenyl-6-methoxyphenol hydroxylase-like FAD-dependent oxidoreductase